MSCVPRARTRASIDHSTRVYSIRDLLNASASRLARRNQVDPLCLFPVESICYAFFNKLFLFLFVLLSLWVSSCYHQCNKILLSLLLHFSMILPVHTRKVGCAKTSETRHFPLRYDVTNEVSVTCSFLLIKIRKVGISGTFSVRRFSSVDCLHPISILERKENCIFGSFFHAHWPRP